MKSDSQDVDPLSESLIARREGCPDPDPAQVQHQDPDFPQDHRKILIEFFVSLVEMQVGIVGQRSWLLVSTTPCFQSQSELESSSHRLLDPITVELNPIWTKLLKFCR